MSSTDFTVAEILKELINIDVTLTVINPNDFDYLGFDPRILLETLLKRAKEKNVSKEQFYSDMSTLCVIGLKRGTMNTKNFGTTSESGKQRYSNLKATYKLVEVSAKNKAPDVVTIPRVIAAMAMLASKINSAHNLARVLNAGYNSQELPACMQHTGFGAIIPSGPAGDIIADSYILHGIELSIVTKSAQDFETAYSNQINFLNIARNSTLYTDKERWIACSLFGLAEKYELFCKFCAGYITDPISKEEYEEAFSPYLRKITKAKKVSLIEFEESEREETSPVATEEERPAPSPPVKRTSGKAGPKAVEVKSPVVKK